MKQYYAEITGWGKCIPPAVLSNEDLSTFLDTSDEWIQSRTGIEQRCISHVKGTSIYWIKNKQKLSDSEF